MEYFKFKYDYKLQRLIWIGESIFFGLWYPMIVTAIIIFLPQLPPTAVSTALIFLSAVLGLISALYNVFKKKGVTLFDNHMEISYHYSKKIMIFYTDISNIEMCEKYKGKYFFDFKGGGRKECLRISYGEHDKIIYFKVDEQKKLFDTIIRKIQQNNQ